MNSSYRPQPFFSLILLMLFGMLTTCSQPQLDFSSTIHQVREGEKLEAIARFYKINPVDLREANHIPVGYQPAPGSELLIPAHDVYANAGEEKKEAEQKNRRRPENRSGGFQPLQISAAMYQSRNGLLSWPVMGTVTREYEGKRFGRHKGIKISARQGEPIRAAATGKVLYSGNEMPGYGNLVIIDHENGYTTHYAFNQRNHVVPGQRVRRGETIALVGKSGPESDPMLHFEVRYNSEAVNPLKYLPVSRQVASR